MHDLAAVADGNLSPQGLQRLTDHLRRCQTCTATLTAVVEDTRAARGESHRLAAWLSSVPWPGPRIAGADTDRGES
jgi:anti-sigma factor RsiW